MINKIKPLINLAVGLPGINLVLSLVLFSLYEINIVGAVLLAYNFSGYMTYMISGFNRSNLIRFSDRNQYKYLRSSIKRQSFLVGLIILSISIISYFTLSYLLLRLNIGITNQSILIISFSICFNMINSYFISFINAYGNSNYTQFFSSPFNALALIICLSFFKLEDANEIFAVFIIVSSFKLCLTFLLLIKYFYYKKQVLDQRSIKDEIHDALANMAYIISESYFIFWSFIFINFTLDKTLLALFNSMFSFYRSSGSMRKLSNIFYLPRYRKLNRKGGKVLNKFLKEGFYIYLSLFVCISLLFIALIDIVFIYKPELSIYRLSIILIFIAGLIFNSSSLPRVIYSVDNRFVVTKFNYIHAFLNIILQLLLYLFKIQTLENIAIFFLFGSIAYMTHITFVLRSLSLRNTS